jgi:hypothetical protein
MLFHLARRSLAREQSLFLELLGGFLIKHRVRSVVAWAMATLSQVVAQSRRALTPTEK